MLPKEVSTKVFCKIAYHNNMYSQVKEPIDTTSFILSFTSKDLPLTLTADKLVLVLTFWSLSDEDVSHAIDTAASESIRSYVGD